MTTDPTPARHRHRTPEVEAVQWTGDNADQLRAFCGPDFDEIDLDDRTEDPDETAAVRESKHGTWRGLKPGDWVVKLDEGFYEFSAADFAEAYEPAAVSSPPPDQTAVERIAEVLRPHASLGGTPPRYQLPFFDGATPSLPRISGWKPLDDVAAALAAVLPPHTDQAALQRVRAVLETEAVVGRSALEYRGLIVSALMAAEAQQPSRDCPSCAAGITHTEHCPTPESHNWGCGCPGDRLPLYSDRGVDTPGCDCAHNGMGMRWHDGNGCAWFRQLTDEGRRLLAENDGAEAQQQPDTETEPESCAHCGKTIRRITGTLTEWWVHVPGGQAFCYPWQPASSPRATPQPAMPVQPAAADTREETGA